MKVLLFITSYRQLEEYIYFQKLLEKLPRLSSICDIFVYCNNTEISGELVTYFQRFPQKNKQLFITSKNNGFARGGIEAVSNAYDMGIFTDYDYVIHLHADVFIFDDEQILKILFENLENDIVFFITKSIPNDPYFFSFDFFMFKPRLLTHNVFKGDGNSLYTFSIYVEYHFYNLIVKNGIKFTYIPRFHDDDWQPRRIAEHLKIYHEHDIDKIKDLCK
jgi:hypothetical protein